MTKIISVIHRDEMALSDSESKFGMVEDEESTQRETENKCK